MRRSGILRRKSGMSSIAWCVVPIASTGGSDTGDIGADEGAQLILTNIAAARSEAQARDMVLISNILSIGLENLNLGQLQVLALPAGSGQLNPQVTAGCPGLN